MVGAEGFEPSTSWSRIVSPKYRQMRRSFTRYLCCVLVPDRNGSSPQLLADCDSPCWLRWLRHNSRHNNNRGVTKQKFTEDERQRARPFIDCCKSAVGFELTLKEQFPRLGAFFESKIAAFTEQGRIKGV